MSYTVGEMARILGVPSSTLRYYDKEGLLPFVARSSGGIRIFTEKDYEWLQVIICLKKAGMSLKDIREYILLAMQGDETIDPRLQLFYKQRETLKEQMEELQRTMEMLEYKCWYYETAKEAGTLEVMKNMTVDDIPERFQNVRRELQDMPEQEKEHAARKATA